MPDVLFFDVLFFLPHTNQLFSKSKKVLISFYFPGIRSYGDHRCVTHLYHIPLGIFYCVI